MAERRGHNATLGEFVVYGEQWWRSVLVVAIWLVPGVLWLDVTPSTVSSCISRGGLWCGPDIAAANAGLGHLISVTSLAIAGWFVWRRLFRRPGLIVGELGFENRTPVLHVERVLWSEVVGIREPTRWLWLRSMGVVPASGVGHHMPILVRTTGLSRPAREIEGYLRSRAEAAMTMHPHRISLPRADTSTTDPARALEEAAVLVGTLVETGPDEVVTRRDITAPDLRRLLVALEPGRSYLVMTMPADRDDQHFIQTARITDGAWHVEFRDGGPDSHCFAECANLDRLTGIFVDWATGGSSWIGALDWLPTRV